MLARTYFSHKELQGKSQSDIHEMLYQKNVNWANLPDNLKNGTLITSDKQRIHSKLDYENLKLFIDNLNKENE